MAEGNNNGVRIYDVIERLEDILEGSPRPKGIGNNDKRVVDMSLFEDLLGDIKVLIPDDVRHANNILLESDRIIDGARQQSEDIIASAQERADAMLEEAQSRAHEMITSARKQSKQLVEDAQKNSNEMRMAAQKEYEQKVSEHSIITEAQRRADLLKLKAEHSAETVFINAKVYADGILADVERFLDGYRNSIEENRAELGVKHLYEKAASDASNAQSKDGDGTADAVDNEAHVRTDMPKARHIPNDEEFIRYDDEEADEDKHAREKRPIFGFLRRKKREMDFDDEYDDYDA